MNQARVIREPAAMAKVIEWQLSAATNYCYGSNCDHR